MKALVTGGAGFIGSHMCERLLKDCNSVVVVDNLSHGSKSMIERFSTNPEFSFVEADVFDDGKMDKVFAENNIDIVFHFASNAIEQIGLNVVDHDVKELFNTTIAVLKKMSEYGVKKFVFASSSTVYGNVDTVMREMTEHLRPVSFYGAAKLASEAFISAFSYAEGIQSWVIRMCNVIGPDVNHGIVFDIKKQIASGNQEIRLLGDGSQSKPFIYVDDLTDGIMHIISKTTDQYNVFQIGNEVPITISEVAETVVNALAPERKIVFSDTKHTWKGDVEQYRFDNTKTMILGWTPKLKSLEAIIKSVNKL